MGQSRGQSSWTVSGSSDDRITKWRGIWQCPSAFYFLKISFHVDHFFKSYYWICSSVASVYHFWLCWVCVARCGLSLVVASGGHSSLHCSGFYCCTAWALGHSGFSSCGSWALEHGLNSCGTWAYLLHGVWDLPGPGIKPVSPALAGGFLSKVPPGKSLLLFLYFGFLAEACES